MDNTKFLTIFNKSENWIKENQYSSFDVTWQLCES